MTCPPSQPSTTPWSAFYGDPELAEFYFKRLRWHAKTGQLVMSRRPFWQHGTGTISAAMVHNSDPEIFERMTGLPYSLGLILEMLDLTRERNIERIAAALRPGLDTSNVAAAVLRAWFANPACDWTDLIAHDEVDELRQQWLEVCGRWLSGQRNIDWEPLTTRMRAALQPDNALRSVQNAVLDTLLILSPPPPSANVRSWQSATVGQGVHTKFMVAQFACGWRAADFAKEVELFQWFSAREKQEPGAKFTAATLQAAQAEWERLPKDPGYIAKEKWFFEHMDDTFVPINEQLLATVIAQLRAASTTGSAPALRDDS